MATAVDRELAAARKLADGLADIWWLVQPSDVLRARALKLVDRYNLRAADALQLAAQSSGARINPMGECF